MLDRQKRIELVAAAEMAIGGDGCVVACCRLLLP
jgi:hypothetical protein